MAGWNCRGQSKTYDGPGLHRRDSFWEEMAMNARGDYNRKPENYENFHHEGFRFCASQSEGARSALAPDAHATYLASWQINRVTGSKVSHKAGWYVRHMAKWHVTQLSGMQSTHLTHCHFRPFAGWPVKYITRWDVTHTSRTEGTRLSGWKHGAKRPVHSSGDSGYQGCTRQSDGVSSDDTLGYLNTSSIHSRCRPGPRETPWTSRLSMPSSINSLASTSGSNPYTLYSSFSSTPAEHMRTSRFTINRPSSSPYAMSPNETGMKSSRYNKNMSSSINYSYPSTPTERAWSSKYSTHLPSGSDFSFPPSPNEKVWTPRYSHILQHSVNDPYTSHQGINTNFQCSANSRSYERLHAPRFDRSVDEAFDHSLNEEKEKSYRSAETTAMEWKENEQRKAWAAELEDLMKKYHVGRSPLKDAHERMASTKEDIATKRPERKVTYKSCDAASTAHNYGDEGSLKSCDLKTAARKESGNRSSKSTEADDEVSQSVKTETCRLTNAANAPTIKVKEKMADTRAVLEELIRKYSVGSAHGSSHPKNGDSEDCQNSTCNAADIDDKIRKPEKRVTYSPIEPKTYVWKDSEHTEKRSSYKYAEDNFNKSFRPEKYRSRQTWKYSDRKSGQTIERDDITGNYDTKGGDRAKSADLCDIKKKSEKKVTYNLSEQKASSYKEGDSRPYKSSVVDEITKKYDARSRTYRPTEPLVFLRNNGERRSRSSPGVDSLLKKYGAGRSSSSTDVNVLMRKYGGVGTLASSNLTVCGAGARCSTNRSSESVALMSKSGVNATWGDVNKFSCALTDPLSITKRDELSLSKMTDAIPKSWSYDFRVWPTEVRTALWRDAISSSWRTGMSGSWRNAFMPSWERPRSVFSDEQYRTWQEDISITLSAVYTMGFRLTRALVTHQLETNLRPSSSMV